LKSDNVQMQSEKVVIDILQDEEDGQFYQYAYTARVRAEFNFFTGVGPENMQVGFPLEDLMTLNLGETMMPKDFTVKVQDQAVQTETIKLNENSYSDDWIVWNMSFGTGLTKVEVEYFLPSYTGLTYYILETGAGWKDAIESAVVEINLPEQYNLAEYEQAGLIGARKSVLDIYDPSFIVEPAGYEIVNNKIVWNFVNLEPTKDNNIVLGLKDSKIYDDLVVAKRAVKEVADADAYISLAKAYLPLSENKWGCPSGIYKELAEQSLMEVYSGTRFDSIEKQAICAALLAQLNMCSEYTPEDGWNKVNMYVLAADNLAPDNQDVQNILKPIKEDALYQEKFPVVEEDVNPAQTENVVEQVEPSNDLYVIIGVFVLLLAVFGIAFLVRNSKK